MKYHQPIEQQAQVEFEDFFGNVVNVNHPFELFLTLSFLGNLEVDPIISISKPQGETLTFPYSINNKLVLKNTLNFPNIENIIAEMQKKSLQVQIKNK